MQKQALFKIKGMQRDLSASAFNPEYAYENKNIRLNAEKYNTLGSVNNEKGTKLLDIINMPYNIKGMPIGYDIIDKELIVFSAGDKSNLDTDIQFVTPLTINIPDYSGTLDIDEDSEDRIYSFSRELNDIKGKTLYRGNLNFSRKNPIETITYFENEDIKKIYWTDGINQPRLINIKAVQKIVNKWNDQSFDFVRELQLNEKVTIERGTVSNASFSPGIIQYAFTYFDKYGQESNIAYVSPLFYISYEDRGASPEDLLGNSFNLTIDNIDSNFDYLRLYSIHRTSVDATPNVKRVADIAPPEGTSIYYESYYKTISLKVLTEVFDTNTGNYEKLDNYPPSINLPDYDLWTLNSNRFPHVKTSLGEIISLVDTNSMFTIKVSTDAIIEFISGNNDWLFKIETKLKKKVSYTDIGTSGDSTDPTYLLYVGGEEVIFSTLAQKDNTLFLGDVNLNRKLLSDSIKAKLKNVIPDFYTYTGISNADKSIKSPIPKGYYPYKNSLDLNARQFKTFKYLEWYRLGVQFQHYTGKWSEPIWLDDKQNLEHIKASYNTREDIYLPHAQAALTDSDLINQLVTAGYKRARPIIVYPNLADREVVCQGVLCPTVYNCEDRFNNTAFAQSSWFARPNAPFDFFKTENWLNTAGGSTANWENYDLPSTYSINSRAGILANERLDAHVNSRTIINMDMVREGAWAEFRHNHPIPDNTKRNAEIQCISNPPSTPVINDIGTTNYNTISNWQEYYFVDQSILTFHSPEIEFDDSIKNMNTDNLKLRIVGVVPLTSTSSDIDIQTSTPVNNFKGSSDFPMGFYKENIGSENLSRFGWKGLINGPFWIDEMANYKDGATNNQKKSTGFVVYPWQRNGSLNNTKAAKDGYKSALLDKKKMSNLRYSYNTHYLNYTEIWKAEIEGNNTNTGISGVSIYNSEEDIILNLPEPKNSNLGTINYKGNIDKVLTPARVGLKTNGYPIVSSGMQSVFSGAHDLFTGDYAILDDTYTEDIRSMDPVRIKYKSSPHAVMALNYTNNNYQRILPTIKEKTDAEGEWDVNDMSDVIVLNTKFFWEKDHLTNGISQDVIPLYIDNNSINFGVGYGFFWLAELYNDNVVNRFGGQTEEAFENNQWLPCGESVSLLDSNSRILTQVELKWTEGDTYYQRYDNLKTFPESIDDQNGVTDIVSFMCETRVNIDGRYDRNRGQHTNFTMTPKNFNLINKAYTQDDNFYTYRHINTNKLNLDNFKNTITWSKNKVAGDLIDTWTNITLANTLDLDGDKGKINSLKRFNNEIIAFQDKGISNILFNSRTQLSSEQGVPIEIANSGKVEGKRYITDKLGCNNKWSIGESPSGLYFVDDITKGIYLFNGKIINLSKKLGFNTWLDSVIQTPTVWNPLEFKGFKTNYDSTTGDMLFTTKDYSLAYSEMNGQFTSFYDYNNLSYLPCLEDLAIAIHRDDLDLKSINPTFKLWELRGGDYNYFFNTFKPFYTTVIVNPDAMKDKVFNNVEFMSDSWDNDILLQSTFDKLETWNEYQKGILNLENINNKPSSLKRKFRTWKTLIPRDINNKRDRMRNPWLYLKLIKEKENNHRLELHNIIVKYFE